MPLDLALFNHLNIHLPGFHKELGTFVPVTMYGKEMVEMPEKD